MKKLLLLLVLSILISCKKEKQLTLAFAEPSEIEKSILIDKKNDDVYSKYYGFWVGECKSVFGKGKTSSIQTEKIKLKIEKITENEVIAKTLFIGYYINLKGTILDIGNKLKIELEDDFDKDSKLYVYSFEISENEIKGQRVSYGNPTFKSPKGIILLHKKEFNYNKYNFPKPIKYLDKSVESENNTNKFILNGGYVITNGTEKINASLEILTEKKLKNLKKSDLELVKNTIYARHGLIFKSVKMQRYFNDCDWYLPVSENINAELTPLEKTNMELLTRFEKYAKENYTYFGR